MDALARPANLPLEIRGLQVSYGATAAVQGLSLEVRPGEIYGLLGPNGAGKSSTLRAVVGLTRPQGGELRIFGYDPVDNGIAAKAMVGYVPETPLLFDALTPREFLEFVANVRRLKSQDASDRVNLYARALEVEGELEQPISTLSQGTRQKFVLTAALLHQPPLLVLDEPFNTLDPRAVRLMKELLPRYVAQSGRGVLFCTHTTEVAEQLCHRIGILDHGRMILEGTLRELRESTKQPTATLEEIFLTATRGTETVRKALESLGGG